jgi:hypothetical protein
LRSQVPSVQDFFASGLDAAEQLGLLPDPGRIHHHIASCVSFRPPHREKFLVP